MRKTIMVLTSLLLLLTTSHHAFAANPKWVTDSAGGFPSAVVSSTYPFTLTVKARATGLGSLATYSWNIGPTPLKAPTLNIGCRTNSGNFPNGTNKVSGNLYSVSASDTSSSSGNLTISILIPPANLSSLPSCGTGQTLAVRSVGGQVRVTMAPLSDLDISLTKN